VMEEGRLTDSFGRKVDFRNCILIMTSNVGVDLLKQQGDMGFRPQSDEENYDKMKERLMDAAKKTFRPEFLNRVDDIIVFHQLTRSHLKKVIDIELEEVKVRLRERGMDLILSPEVIQFLIEKGYDPSFGARPLKRTIQKYIENVLAEDILTGKLKDGHKIRAEIRGDFIVFEKTS